MTAKRFDRRLVEDASAVLDAMAGPTRSSSIRRATDLSHSRVSHALAYLLGAGRIEFARESGGEFPANLWRIVERGSDRVSADSVRRTLAAREAGSFPDQRSTGEQLRDLRAVANLLGLYDAADAIGRMLEQSRRGDC